MSGHATAGPVEGSQAVLERIQVTVLPSTTKTAPVNPIASFDSEMKVMEVKIFNLQLKFAFSTFFALFILKSYRNLLRHYCVLFFHVGGKKGFIKYPDGLDKPVVRSGCRRFGQNNDSTP